MLVGAVTRLTSGRGDPVIQLQTNFGGGKTHSMLALYHLFSGTPPTSLAGVDELMAEAAVRMDLDRIPLWQDHVDIRQLAEHYSRYTCALLWL